MRKILFLMLVGFIVLSVNSYALDQATDFDTVDIKGNPFKLSDYKGNVIFLNFFATWCPPCRAEMPDFQKLSEEYPDDLKVIAIHVGRDPLDRVEKFVNEQGLNFSVCMDTSGEIQRLYGPIRAIPVTVIIDKEFNIIKKYIGARNKEVFENDIKEHIA